MIRGKSYKAMATDIAEGYVAVNPLFLKPLDEEALKGLYQEILKLQSEVRAEKFTHTDISAIRVRNSRLQKLQLAITVIKNYARERKIFIA